LAKIQWKPSTLLNPVPAVMLTCVDNEGKPNIITVAWAGTINTTPPMLSVSIKKERFSHDLIKETGEFVVNLTTEKLVRETDLCGVKSGRNVNKFELTGLTTEPGKIVKVPLIKESPINIECVVKQVLELGSHDMFISEVVGINVDEALIDKAGKLCLDRAGLIAYTHGEYWSLNKSLGFFGFSVQKKKSIKRTIKK